MNWIMIILRHNYTILIHDIHEYVIILIHICQASPVISNVKPGPNKQICCSRPNSHFVQIIT